MGDFSNLLAEVWRQLDVECPQFEMAYAWMRFKQGAGDRPLIRHSGKVSTGWDFVKEATGAGFSWVPGLNLIVWATDKLGKAAVSKLKETGVGQRLLTQVGQEDYLRLSRMTAQEIYPTLTERLGEDLGTQLPERNGKRGRAVVFLDTFEDVAGGEQNEARRQVVEEPVGTLYMHLKCVLLVMFGRDRLTWDEIDPEWGDRSNLQQHLLFGLSATMPLCSWQSVVSILDHSWRRSFASRATSRLQTARPTTPSAWAFVLTRFSLSAAEASSPSQDRSPCLRATMRSWPSIF